ncbi:MAG: GGDEF domain-containing protein [Candidatus Moduliflexus flocculans]|nr:GGDEF domain-containing protein [Candidatus Moduliflexus flocculans]
MEEEVKALSLHDELTTLLQPPRLPDAGRTAAEDRQPHEEEDRPPLPRRRQSQEDQRQRRAHSLGDRALVEIAFHPEEELPRSPTSSRRLGGDEFSVLAMESTKMDADVLVQRLEEKLELFNARSSAEAGFTLSASIGVYTREPDQPGDDRGDAQPGRRSSCTNRSGPGRAARLGQAARTFEIAAPGPPPALK